MEQILASLNTQMTLSSAQKREDVLNKLTSTGNQYVDAFIKIFLITFSSLAVGNIINYFRNFKLRDLQLYILFRYIFPNRINKIEFFGEELGSFSRQKNWDLSDSGLALLWYISKNMKSYSNINSLKEIPNNEIICYWYSNKIKTKDKDNKIYKEPRFRIDQEDNINSKTDIHIKDNIWIKVSYYEENTRGRCKIIK